MSIINWKLQVHPETEKHLHVCRLQQRMQLRHKLSLVNRLVRNRGTAICCSCDSKDHQLRPSCALNSIPLNIPWKLELLPYQKRQPLQNSLTLAAKASIFTLCAVRIDSKIDVATLLEKFMGIIEHPKFQWVNSICSSQTASAKTLHASKPSCMYATSGIYNRRWTQLAEPELHIRADSQPPHTSIQLNTAHTHRLSKTSTPQR